MIPTAIARLELRRQLDASWHSGPESPVGTRDFSRCEESRDTRGSSLQQAQRRSGLGGPSILRAAGTRHNSMMRSTSSALKMRS